MNCTIRRTAVSKSLFLALLLPGFIFFGSVDVDGLGFRIPNQDAEAIARGNAFVATADNPSAIYYNPAGITQLEGKNIQFGIHSISVNSSYRGPNGSRAETDFEVQPVPEFYYTLTPKNKPFSFGLGVYAPFGLGLQWPDNAPFRTLAGEGRMVYVTANPVVAWQIHPNLSLAIGPTINFSKVKLKTGIAVPGDQLKFVGDDFDFGFNAGLLWHPHPKWSVGLSYRSSTSMNYSGSSHEIPYSQSVHTTARIDFPQYFIAGISYRPNQKWNIEFNVDWTDWDALDSVTFKGAKDAAGKDIVLPLNWRASFLYELGVTRYFTNGYFVSGGYFFSGNSTTERNFTPIVPDTDLHVGSLGFGHKGEHWKWAIAGQIITGPWRVVNGSQSASLAGESADGRYRFFNQAVTFSIAYNY